MNSEPAMPTAEAAVNDDERIKREEAAVSAGFWRKLGAFAAKVPFAEDLLTVYYCAFDRTTPTYVRVALMAALAYFVDPFDLIPDMLPVIGLSDDAAVLAGALKLVWDQIKPEHRTAAHAAIERMEKAGQA
jgi:uncharacterized membrane protein YkvA (DUF1232 family)